MRRVVLLLPVLFRLHLLLFDLLVLVVFVVFVFALLLVWLEVILRIVRVVFLAPLSHDVSVGLTL